MWCGIKQLSCPPWKLIFTSAAVYALLLQALLDGAGFYIIYTCYPTYMKTVLNYDITQVRMCKIVTLFQFRFSSGSVFERSRIRFVMSLVQTGLKNSVQFGYCSYLLLM